MLYLTEFLQSAACLRCLGECVSGAFRCPDPAAASSTSGSRTHRTALYCRQADSAAACFCGSAWLALVPQRGYLLCSGVICNPQEHGSVIALDCKSSATCDSRAEWICKLIITCHLRKDLSHGLLSFRGMMTQLGRHARGEPSAELPAARARRQRFMTAEEGV